jgi:hypothetical protein
MRRANLLTAAGLIAVGGLVVWDSLRLGIGWGTDGPRSGFFPFWLAVTMLAACAGIMVQTLREPGGRPFVSRAALRPVLTVLVPAVLFVAAIHVIGLYAAAAVYLAVYMRVIGRHSWLAVLGVSVGFAVAAFVVFETWFLVPMPKGPIEARFGF